MKKNKDFIDCPRCLGKGYVDLNDIKRLRRELYWEPGPHCAYCDGKKIVAFDFASKINPDDWFITSDVDKLLLKRYLKREPKAIREVKKMEDFMVGLVNCIYHLYVNEDKNRSEIVDLLIKDSGVPKKEAEEYVDKVIRAIFSNLIK